MKVGLKSILIVLVLLALVALAFFATSSGKISFNNAGKTENAVLQEDEEDEEFEDSETFENEISLEITSPKAGAIVKESPVLVTGETVKAAEVFVNDAETKADNNGNFKVSIPLDEGENEIVVVVNDAEGNYAEASVIITLNTE